MKTITRTVNRRGPKPPVGGRIRITVNLPREMLASVDGMPGVSRSSKIIAIIKRCTRRLSETSGKKPQ